MEENNKNKLKLDLEEKKNNVAPTREIEGKFTEGIEEQNGDYMSRLSSHRGGDSIIHTEAEPQSESIGHEQSDR